MENKDKKEITSLADFKQVQNMYVDVNGNFYIELKDEPFKTFENIKSPDRIIFYNEPNTDILTKEIWKTIQKDCNIQIPDQLTFTYHPFGIIVVDDYSDQLFYCSLILYDEPESLIILLGILNDYCVYDKIVHKNPFKGCVNKINSKIVINSPDDCWTKNITYPCFMNNREYTIQYERPRFVSEIGNKTVNSDSCSTTVHLYDKDLIGDKDIDKEEGMNIDEFITSKVAELNIHQLTDFLKFLLDLPENDDVDVMRAKTLTKLDEMLGI